VRACALFAHCFTCSKDLKAAVNISRAMTQQGLAVMRFDFTGLGETTAVGGDNLGPTPYDLLASALGACTTMTLRMYADRKQWPLEEATVTLKHSRVHGVDEERCEHADARLDRLDRELTLTGPLTAAQRQRLLEIADRCPVHRTLSAGVRIATRLEDSEVATP
jgi:uncharacterized OsmC-like protein